MQASVMIGNDLVGRAHDVVRVNKFSVERLVLENTPMETTPWENPLGLVVDGKVVQVRFASWEQCNQEGNHLVFKHITFNVVD